MSANVRPEPAEQMSLDDLGMLPIVAATGTTIQERFTSFHASNPWVLPALERLTEDYLRTGQKRVGIAMLFEVLRYQHGRTYGDSFKLNNSFRSRYVREILRRRPEWSEVFETRELKAA